MGAQAQESTSTGAGWRWTLLSIAGLIATAGVACSSSDSSSSASSSKTVKADHLDSLLLDSGQLSALVGAQMKVGSVSDGAMKTAGGLSRANCFGALNAGQELTYTDSGYTDLKWSDGVDNPERVEHYAVQAVAVFPEADSARAFVANSADQWRSCTDQVITTVKPEQEPENWRTAGLIGVPPKISMSASREGEQPWVCQRAMRAVANMVVDVTACGQHIGNQGRQLGDKIADNI